MTVTERLDARIQRTEVDPTAARLLDAAVERFATVGIRRTTMDDVAAAAGIGRATLYRRFASRDELVQAAVLRELARFVTEVDDRIQGLGGATEQFVEGFVAILVAARRHPLLDRLLEIEPELILPHLTVQAAPVLAFARDELAHRLEASRQGGEMRPDVDPALVAELLVRLCHSLLLTPAGLGIDPDDERGLRRLAHAYLAPALFVPTGDRTDRDGSAPERLTDIRP